MRVSRADPVSIVALAVSLAALVLAAPVHPMAAQEVDCLPFDPSPNRLTYPAGYSCATRTLWAGPHVVVGDVNDSPDLVIERGGNAGDDTAQPLPLGPGTPLGRLYWRGHGGDASPIWNAAAASKPWIVDWSNASSPAGNWAPGNRDGSAGEIIVRAAEQFTVDRRGSDMELWLWNVNRPSEGARRVLRIKADGTLELTQADCNPDLGPCRLGQLRMDADGRLLVRVIGTNGSAGPYVELARNAQ